MTADGVELGRYPDAPSARAAARRLLAVGITPDVQHDGDEHVLRVANAYAAAGAATLGVEPRDGVGDDSSSSPLGGDTTAAATTGPRLADDAGEGEILDVDDQVMDVDDQGFVVVALGRDEAETYALAASLLEHGIGVEVGGAVEAGYANPLMGEIDARVVRVLEIDVARAAVVLGTERPRRLSRPTPLSHLPAPPITESDVADATGPTAPAAPPAPPKRIGAEKPAEVREYLGGRLRLTKRQLLTGIIVYVAALILIPLLFYYVTRWALDPGDGDPADTIPGFTETTVD